MRKFEKKLCVLAIIFVVIYLGAVATTIKTRINNSDTIARLESARPGPGEGQLMLAELFLPMMILLAVTVCFVIVRNKRTRDILILEENEKGIKPTIADNQSDHQK